MTDDRCGDDGTDDPMVLLLSQNLFHRGLVLQSGLRTEFPQAQCVVKIVKDDFWHVEKTTADRKTVVKESARKFHSAPDRPKLSIV